MSAKVAIVVSEDGDVVQTQIVFASPRESVEAMLNATKQAKFQLIFNLDRQDFGGNADSNVRYLRSV